MGKPGLDKTEIIEESLGIKKLLWRRCLSLGMRGEEMEGGWLLDMKQGLKGCMQKRFCEKKDFWREKMESKGSPDLHSVIGL